MDAAPAGAPAPSVETATAEARNRPFAPENVPQELRGRAQWVAWRYEISRGRLTKIPVCAGTGRNASTTDSGTWASFAAAREAVARDPTLAGVGFVFSPDDPLCGVDLDHSRNPETGEIAAWAREAIDLLGSYSEISPSQAGIKVWTRARLPGKGRKKYNDNGGAIEMYDRGRFFTVTSQALPGASLPAESRQDEFDYLYRAVFGAHEESPPPEPQPPGDPPGNPPRSAGQFDSEIIAKAHRASNGVLFGRLWSGRWQEAGYSSQSEADAALLAMLRYWTSGDKARAFRMFSSSGLHRDKWEREDYRERTWKAVDNGPVWNPEATGSDKRPPSDAPADSPPRRNPAPKLPPPLEAGDWSAEELPEPDQVLANAIDTNTKNVVVAPSKARKSFLLLQLALCLAAGLAMFLVWSIPRARRVLLLQFEITPIHFHKRLCRLMRGLGIQKEQLAGRLHIINARGCDVGIFSEDEIVRHALALKAEVIILDPIYKLIDGDENKTEVMKPLLRMFDQVANRTGAAIIYAHHTGKGVAGDRQAIDRMVGSGVMARDFDTQLSLVPHVQDGLLVCEQIARSYPPLKPFSLAWKDECCCFELSDEPAAVRTSMTRQRPAAPEVAAEDPRIMQIFSKGALPAQLLVERLQKLGMTCRDAKARKIQMIHEGVIESFREPKFNPVTYCGTKEQIAKLREKWERPELPVAEPAAPPPKPAETAVPLTEHA